MIMKFSKMSFENSNSKFVTATGAAWEPKTLNFEYSEIYRRYSAYTGFVAPPRSPSSPKQRPDSASMNADGWLCIRKSSDFKFQTVTKRPRRWVFFCSHAAPVVVTNFEFEFSNDFFWKLHGHTFLELCSYSPGTKWVGCNGPAQITGKRYFCCVWIQLNYPRSSCGGTW